MLCGGKPVGFKICLGNPSEFLGLCMAMQQEQSFPDFITIDGGEGGTGAAPLEFSNSVGAPLTEGIVMIHNALVGFGIRQPIKLIASGKILTGFDMAKRLAAGADLCNMARGFMFSLGCIQARRCNSNDCPVGVTTQQDKLVKGLVVKDKTTRVANFQQETVQAFRDILGAAGLERADDLTPWHIIRRISQTEVRSYAQIYKYLRPSQLLSDDVPDVYADWLSMASPERFEMHNAYGKYSTSTQV
jgi:glutamate synthase domain-containing protein 2